MCTGCLPLCQRTRSRLISAAPSQWAASGRSGHGAGLRCSRATSAFAPVQQHDHGSGPARQRLTWKRRVQFSRETATSALDWRRGVVAAPPVLLFETVKIIKQRSRQPHLAYACLLLLLPPAGLCRQERSFGNLLYLRYTMGYSLRCCQMSFLVLLHPEIATGRGMAKFFLHAHYLFSQCPLFPPPFSMDALLEVWLKMHQLCRGEEPLR